MPKCLPLSTCLSLYFLQHNPLPNIHRYCKLSQFLGNSDSLPCLQGGEQSVSLRQLKRRLLPVAGPLVPNRVPLSRTQWKFVIANATKYPIIYLPVFCMRYMKTSKHSDDVYAQKKVLCKHKHHEGGKIYKEKRQ